MFNINIGFSDFLLVYSAYMYDKNVVFSIICFSFAVIGIICRSALEKHAEGKEDITKKLLDELKTMTEAIIQVDTSKEGYH